jgi:hypothetical protein
MKQQKMTRNKREQKLARVLQAERNIPYTKALAIVRADYFKLQKEKANA